MKLNFQFILGCILVFLFACRKQIDKKSEVSFSENKQMFFPEKGELRAPSTDEEIRAVKQISTITPILLEVYKNPLARKEVNAAILSGFYKDESVMLVDLLNWGNSPIYKTAKFRSICTQPGVFSIEFRKALETKEINSNNRINTGDYYSYENIAIYFPYSDMYQNENQENLVSLLPAEFEGNYGTGFEPTICPNGICYETVTIDDEYAATENPTHIITTGPLDPAPTNPNRVDSVPPQPTPQLTVYMGWMRQNTFLDPLVSIGGGSLNRGGNEIRVNRTSAFLRTSPTGDITDFSQPRLDYDFSRSEIANRTWKRLYGVLAPSWRIEDIEQVFSIWEEDNATEVEKGGTFTTTVKVDSFGISVERQTQLTFKLKYRTKNNSSIYAMPWRRDDYIRVSRDQFSPTGYVLRPTTNIGPNILGLPFAIVNQTGSTKDGTFLPQGQFWPIMYPALSTGSWVWPHRIF